MIGRLGLKFYQRVISPALHLLAGPGYGCRFEPTCSRYAEQTIARHGFVRGGALGLWRFCRCHPFARGGHDPVPESSSVIETHRGAC